MLNEVMPQIYDGGMIGGICGDSRDNDAFLERGVEVGAAMFAWQLPPSIAFDERPRGSGGRQLYEVSTLRSQFNAVEILIQPP
jgi:hypothetical protein